MSYDLNLIEVTKKGRAAFATIKAPPINVMTVPLFLELAKLAEEIETDDDVLVLVLKSGDPDFFIAHYDVEAILQMPIESEAKRDPALNVFHVMCERYRTMPKVTIAQIEGRVGGGGSELSASFDMRFGVRGKTIINQMEVPIGILPGGTGTQRLPRLVGRGRALEIILGGIDLDAQTAVEWGYLNRIFEADEIDAFVTKLATRIATFPAPAIKLAKQSVDNAERPLQQGLVEEAYLFQQLIRTDEAQKAMKTFIEMGGQTREGELRVTELCDEVLASLK